MFRTSFPLRVKKITVIFYRPNFGGFILQNIHKSSEEKGMRELRDVW